MPGPMSLLGWVCLVPGPFWGLFQGGIPGGWYTGGIPPLVQTSSGGHRRRAKRILPEGFLIRVTFSLYVKYPPMIFWCCLGAEAGALKFTSSRRPLGGHTMDFGAPLLGV